MTAPSPVPAPDAAALTALLRDARRIAVVGLSDDPAKPSHYVSAYMQRAGYTILPVNPTLAGREVLGERVWPDLPAAAAAAGPIDIVNVFRRSEAVPALVDDCVRVAPRLVWMQQGIRHEGAARRLAEAGIAVVMDRCLMVDHRLLLGR
ncbi:MAG TPA: CoA-binding protein [Gemmatimonadales bacterium]|nr:CoA-binding protein [Gemmatimonadales bacterium]